ncbi:hypothetical protein [Halorussus aquaticus]|uniref:Uncharacterized protein n=1 Tax=Halorussus aquaticus TaxID=2953748 RepID=A0ABD5Q431_9EURY|nr:hypothetical protein [Halorussus aquaticus]
MTDANTDAPPLVNADHATSICTEGPGFAVDEAIPGSEFAEPPEAR